MFLQNLFGKSTLCHLRLDEKVVCGNDGLIALSSLGKLAHVMSEPFEIFLLVAKYTDLPHFA